MMMMVVVVMMYMRRVYMDMIAIEDCFTGINLKKVSVSILTVPTHFNYILSKTYPDGFYDLNKLK